MLKRCHLLLFVPVVLVLEVCVGPRARAAEPAALDVAFELPEARGAVRVALYDSRAAYEAASPLRTASVDADALRVGVRFEGLSAGRYALQAFQDLNEDGRMGRNPVGLPTEPVGFSNDARIRGGAPTWDDTAFDVGPDGAAHVVSLR